MLCETCLEIREDKDFFNGNKICYKCIYKSKIKDINKDKPSNFCRICAKEVFFDKNAKKRQRNVFCSKECATKGHKNLLKNHWTRKLKDNPATKIYFHDEKKPPLHQDRQ